MSEHKIENVNSLLQADYGGTNDCILTSITMVINTYTNNIYKPEAIYNKVARLCKQYGYTCEKGFNPIYITTVLREMSKIYKINKRPHRGYMKNAGYNLAKIQTCIDKGCPVILNLYKCGKYFNHTVLVYGYDGPVLYIYDNWSKEEQKIAYNDISCISSINWLE